MLYLFKDTLEKYILQTITCALYSVYNPGSCCHEKPKKARTAAQCGIYIRRAEP